MRKLVAFPVVIFVLFIFACGNSEPQMENVSIADSPEQPTSETDQLEEQPEESVVYYSFLDIDGTELPTGSVVVLADILVLAPTSTGMICTGDPAVNIREALQSLIIDPRNEWTSSDLDISGVTFSDGHAVVELRGDITAPGGIVLVACCMQVLLTVFAETSVQTSTVILNDECIGILGMSHESEAMPADYVYTRAEIEGF